MVDLEVTLKLLAFMIVAIAFISFCQHLIDKSDPPPPSQ